jgi:hypothetical protein
MITEQAPCLPLDGIGDSATTVGESGASSVLCEDTQALSLQL